MIRKIVRAIGQVDALRYQIVEVNCVDESCEPPEEYTSPQPLEEELLLHLSQVDKKV